MAPSLAAPSRSRLDITLPRPMMTHSYMRARFPKGTGRPKGVRAVIVSEPTRLLTDVDARQVMASSAGRDGNGHAAERVIPGPREATRE